MEIDSYTSLILGQGIIENLLHSYERLVLEPDKNIASTIKNHI